MLSKQTVHFYVSRNVSPALEQGLFVAVLSGVFKSLPLKKSGLLCRNKCHYDDAKEKQH